MTPSTPDAGRRALQSIRHRYGLTGQPRSSASPAAGVIPKPRRRGRWLARILLLTFLLAAIGGGVFGYKIIAVGDKISATDRSIFGQLKDLLFNQGEFLAGETDGRINVLLIAVGGEGHKGENLADTIMIASFKTDTHQAALLSIPRDLYTKVPGEQYYSKINSVHAYGESQRPGRGPEVLRDLVEEISGLPLHYYVRVDFTAFKSIVDAVGGVNITIPNTFEDYWHQISFPAGVEKMTGERALAYVRARYVEGPEGGDFKRAARQQQVLLALREKFFSLDTALDFSKVNTILNSLSDNIRTDLELWEIKRFYELARLYGDGGVNSLVLSSGPQGVLVGGTEMLGGSPASVLKPRTGDYSEIQRLAANMFTSDENDASGTPDESPSSSPTPSPSPSSTPNPTPSPSPSPSPQTALTLEIRNSTGTVGLAQRTAGRLKSDRFKISTVGNADLKNQPETLVYSGHQATAAADLASQVQGKTIANLPAGEHPTQADVLIILGANFKE